MPIQDVDRALRTDFDTEANRTERQWVLGINSHLPLTVSALWVRQVDDEFHARFGAYSRSYRYTILNRWVRPAIGSSFNTWCRYPLNENRMDEAARLLLGEHDFSAFRSSGCSAQHAQRNITAISVRRDQEKVIVEITANAFLYHMVRIIAGTLVEVGRGHWDADDVPGILAACDRRRAGPTMGPEGLCLKWIKYEK